MLATPGRRRTDSRASCILELADFIIEVLCAERRSEVHAEA
jgi:hypothetical protein